MNQKTVLTPMQLFFCAKLMDAVYYDYAYLGGDAGCTKGVRAA